MWTPARASRTKGKCQGRFSSATSLWGHCDLHLGSLPLSRWSYTTLPRLLGVCGYHWGFLHSARTFVNYAFIKPSSDCPKWSMSYFLMGPRLIQSPTLDFLGFLGCNNLQSWLQMWKHGQTDVSPQPLPPSGPSQMEGHSLCRPSVGSSTPAGLPRFRAQVTQARALFPQGTPPL